jgi:hypothetical protein
MLIVKCFNQMIVFSKKTLKITKGQSESLYRRRTDNTMAKRQKNRQYNGQKKRDKRTNNDPQNIHVKLKIE